MNAEIKTRWLAELRSGKYPQTRGVLNRLKPAGGVEPGLCCLGVLCELAVDDGLLVRRYYDSDHRTTEYVTEAAGVEYRSPSTNDGGSSILPTVVVEWAGLDGSFGGEVTFEGKQTDLPGLNDTYRKTFPQIADLIEAQL